MFKMENSIESDVGQDIGTDLLQGGSFSLDEVTNFLSNEPSIIEQTLANFVNSTEPQVPFPVSPIGPPDRYIMYEEAQFVVQINSSDVKRKKYLYSHKLNRIYVDVDTCFCIEFNWNQKMFFNCPMYVRSTVVFSDKAQAQKRVEVCVQHLQSGTSAGKSEAAARHVLLSARSGTEGVHYCGWPDRSDSWYSVLVQFNKSTDDPCLHAYQFVCKNSCSTGINRRAIEIIFTLEDKLGTVYGRQCVGARVCACPNRDIRKDEQDAHHHHAKKRRAEPHHEPHHEPHREHEHEPARDPQPMLLLPALPVADKNIMETGLLMMLRMTEQAAADRSADPQALDDCKKSIAAFKKYLADHKQPRAPPS